MSILCSLVHHKLLSGLIDLSLIRSDGFQIDGHAIDLAVKFAVGLRDENVLQDCCSSRGKLEPTPNHQALKRTGLSPERSAHHCSSIWDQPSTARQQNSASTN